MRYVVVDLAGNQRETFDSEAELIEELREGSLAMPASLRSLYVLTLDDDGREIGSAQRGDEVLMHATGPRVHFRVQLDATVLLGRTITSGFAGGVATSVRPRSENESDVAIVKTP